MAKAVLVMDMPEGCHNCPLILKIPQKNGLALCLGRQEGSERQDYEHESTWEANFCPLRKLPEKEHGDNEYDEYLDGYDAGWNACLDAIIGDKKS